jgi:hypothetical protein
LGKQRRRLKGAKLKLQGALRRKEEAKKARRPEGSALPLLPHEAAASMVPLLCILNRSIFSTDFDRREKTSVFLGFFVAFLDPAKTRILWVCRDQSRLTIGGRRGSAFFTLAGFLIVRLHTSTTASLRSQVSVC